MSNLRFRRSRVAAVAGIASALASAGFALPANAQASRPGAGLPGASTLLTRAPYLADLTSSSVQLTWATTTQSRGVVRYGPAGRCTAHSLTAAQLGSPITVHGVKEYQNSIVVSGLASDTGYCYRITTGGSSPVDLLGSRPSPRFTTLQTASGSKPMTFDVMDDWGDTTNRGVNTGAVNANQAGVDAQIARSGAQFQISVGDVAYQGGTQTNYGDLNQTGPNVSAVFGPSYWAVPGQRIPMFAATGNHGQNNTFVTVWPERTTVAASHGVYSTVSYPSVDGTFAHSYATSYYAFSTGGVRFYMLNAAWPDTNVGTATGGACGAACKDYQVEHDQNWTAASAEHKWLVKDLAAHPGGLKFAFFHFPMYSDTVAEPSDRYLDAAPGRTGSLEQLLNDNGVDLVFNGHAHDYQRNIAVPGGVTSYVTGGGGGSASQVGGHGCATTDAYAIGWFYTTGRGSACGAAAKPTTDAQVYHFLKVTVNGRMVTVTPIDSRGQGFDVHRYNFGHDTTPPSAPGRLAASQPTPTRTTPTSTTLTWTAATDNIGVTGYDIYRNGTYLATVGPSVTSYTDTTASAGVGYSYRVRARDLAGNTTGGTVRVNGGRRARRQHPAASVSVTPRG